VAAAFSLIEVLISVVVLALGLLGLGAVFPVVIREQRLAGEATMGVSAQNNAEAYLLGHSGLRTDQGWKRWLLGPNPDPNVTTDDLPEEWTVPQTDALTGRVGIGAIVLPVTQRLFPQPFAIDNLADSPASEPRLVWDIVGRRLATGTDFSAGDSILLAIFVRRIDPGILVDRSRGQTLSEVLSAPPGQTPERVPVAWDPVTKRPTLNGIGEYATPITMGVVRIRPPRIRDIIQLDLRLDISRPRPPVTGQQALALIRRVGQKLVDNRGNVYSVIEVIGDDEVRVEPGVPVEIDQPRDMEPVVFTPQIPVAVATFRINP